MTNRNRDRQAVVRKLLRSALSSPEHISAMSPRDLDLMLRVARRVKLLGTLAARLQDAGLLESLPQVASDQLTSALALADSRARLALWEIDRIHEALKTSTVAGCITMKGCTYLLLGLPNAPGRIFADVDLMFSESGLAIAEAHLNQHGWHTAELTPYDDNYYRKWTHEIPPLLHEERDVEIDMHHSILPRTARSKPDAELLLQGSQGIDGSPYRALGNEDIVLHAITHLISNDELSDKLRDLVDIDVLLRHFCDSEPDFWSRLLDRAVKLDLRRPTFYGLRYVKKLLDCPVPESIIEKTSAWAPPRSVVWLMDRLAPRALFPIHPDFPSRLSETCRLLLFVRSHWIRMPPWLLVYHLSVKIFRTTIWRR